MANLTKEYFDSKIEKLEENLKEHTESEVADLAGIVSGCFDELEKKLDLRA